MERRRGREREGEGLGLLRVVEGARAQSEGPLQGHWQDSREEASAAVGRDFSSLGGGCERCG